MAKNKEKPEKKKKDKNSDDPEQRVELAPGQGSGLDEVTAKSLPGDKPRIKRQF